MATTGAVYDSVLDAYWQGSVSSNETWLEAALNCAASDLLSRKWTLPHTWELLSLLSSKGEGLAPPMRNHYWSADTAGTFSAWLVTDAYEGLVGQNGVGMRQGQRRCISRSGAARFEQTKNGIKDKVFRLIWSDSVSNKLTFKSAIQYCGSRSPQGTWRLPRKHELLGIINPTEALPSTFSEFKHLKVDALWATLEKQDGAVSAAAVPFREPFQVIPDEMLVNASVAAICVTSWNGESD